MSQANGVLFLGRFGAREGGAIGVQAVKSVVVRCVRSGRLGNTGCLEMLEVTLECRTRIAFWWLNSMMSVGRPLMTSVQQVKLFSRQSDASAQRQCPN